MSRCRCVAQCGQHGGLLLALCSVVPAADPTPLLAAGPGRQEGGWWCWMPGTRCRAGCRQAAGPARGCGEAERPRGALSSETADRAMGPGAARGPMPPS